MYTKGYVSQTASSFITVKASGLDGLVLSVSRYATLVTAPSFPFETQATWADTPESAQKPRITPEITGVQRCSALSIGEESSTGDHER